MERMDEKTKTAAELLVECLENEGVEYIFGIPGEENLEVVEAISNSNIKFVTTRHEQGAAFMADVYGRLTGKAGVCLSTLGPGATNLVTGVADANSDGAPLVAITGQVGTERMHLTSHQYLDLMTMFEPITKRTKQIVRPDTINEIIRIAFKYAEGEKQGATHVDLPVNIARMPVSIDEKPLKKIISKKEFADMTSIEEASALIFKAERPIILAGNGAQSVAVAVTEFAETLKIPVVNTMMGKGVIPVDSRYSLWTIGIPQKDFVNQAMDKADLVVCIGYDLVEYSPAKWNPDENKTIIHIGTRPAHINKHYQAAVEVVGDVSDALFGIMRRTTRNSEPEFAFEIRDKIRKEHFSYENDNSFPVKPQKALIDIRKIMNPEDIMVCDVGAHKMWVARHYNCYMPNTCIISNGFASMGIALPGAIAAKLINPDKKVLALCGDGGFMMNNQEMETALRIGVNIVVVIFTDSSYGLIKWKQNDRFGESHFVDFTNPDFVKMAESFGAVGYKVEKTEDFLPILEDAFKQNKPCIIECPVDYSENTKLSERLSKLS